MPVPTIAYHDCEDESPSEFTCRLISPDTEDDVLLGRVVAVHPDVLESVEVEVLEVIRADVRIVQVGEVFSTGPFNVYCPPVLDGFDEDRLASLPGTRWWLWIGENTSDPEIGRASCRERV